MSFCIFADTVFESEVRVNAYIIMTNTATYFLLHGIQLLVWEYLLLTAWPKEYIVKILDFC